MIRSLILALSILIPIKAIGAISIVEIPIRIESIYLKRVAGTTDFFWIGRLPNQQVIAIPEAELQRFLGLARTEGFDRIPLDDPRYLPSPQQAVGNTAKATITIEHLDQLAFWMNRDFSFFITWDDEHPAPPMLVDGSPILAITEWRIEQPPRAPQPAQIKP